MPKLTTKSGQTVIVSDDRVAAWEARGYSRADQPAKTTEEPKKAPAKKSSPKKSNK